MTSKEGVQRGLWGILIALPILFMNSHQAEARGREHDDWGHRRYEHHRRYDNYRPVVVLPGKYITITIGGQRYYHCNGRYFKRRQRDYVQVPEPFGVVITTIPRGYHKVYIDGSIYYTYNGNYYLQVAGGYRLIDRPSARVINDVVEEDVDIQPETRSGDSFSVNIPNSKGGYTAVTLKRSGTGYTGPQGEYYPEFPKVEQLRAMYAK